MWSSEFVGDSNGPGNGALKYRLGDLNIAECPELRTVNINETMFIGRSENEVGELRIINCPALCPKIVSIITDEGDICHCEDE